MQSASYTLADLKHQLAKSGESWFEFLSLSTLSMGVYRIPAGTCDRRTHEPHDRDEIYIATSGRGRLTVDGEQFDVAEGTILFVKAGVEHFFHDVTDDLTVLVFFAGSQSHSESGTGDVTNG